MFPRSRRFKVLPIVILALGATPAAGQIGLAIRASTLGVGSELSFRPNRNVGLRAGGNYFRFTRSTTIEGVSYDMTPRFQSGSATLDLHPLGNAFHFSGGIMWNQNRGDVTAQLTGPVTIGGTTYQPSEVGSLSGRVDYSTKFAPYAGLGFAGRGRVSLVFDLGVVFSGHPRATLTGTTSLTGPAKTVFDQNVQQEIQDIQAEIESRSYLKYYPVVSLGLRVGF